MKRLDKRKPLSPNAAEKTPPTISAKFSRLLPNRFIESRITGSTRGLKRRTGRRPSACIRILAASAKPQVGNPLEMKVDAGGNSTTIHGTWSEAECFAPARLRARERR